MMDTQRQRQINADPPAGNAARARRRSDQRLWPRCAKGADGRAAPDQPLQAEGRVAGRRSGREIA